jgi:hypothetical protein
MSRRPLLAVALAAVLAVALPAQAGAAPHQAKTAAGVKAAALKVSWVKSVFVATTPAAATRGIAYLSLSGFSGGGPGCGAVWGYTGAFWHPLSVCSQESEPYPANLPGKILICHGTGTTVVRSGPAFSKKVLVTLKKDTKVGSTAFLLTLPATSTLDGVGWYRVTVGATTGWVASFRTASTSEGCAAWASYWKYSKHR